MGSLKKLRLPTSEITVPGGGNFTVRGVSLIDVSALVRHHRPALTELFKRVTTGKDVAFSVSTRRCTMAASTDTIPIG